MEFDPTDILTKTDNVLTKKLKNTTLEKPGSIVISAVESKDDNHDKTCQFDISVKPPTTLSDLNYLAEKVGYFVILTKRMDSKSRDLNYRPFYKTECQSKKDNNEATFNTVSTDEIY